MADNGPKFSYNPTDNSSTNAKVFGPEQHRAGGPGDAGSPPVALKNNPTANLGTTTQTFNNQTPAASTSQQVGGNGKVCESASPTHQGSQPSGPYDKFDRGV